MSKFDEILADPEKLDDLRAVMHQQMGLFMAGGNSPAKALAMAAQAATLAYSDEALEALKGAQEMIGEKTGKAA